MKLIDKIKIGLCGVMLAGTVATAASFYSIINPIVQMAENPTEATEEAKIKYVLQYPTKEKVLYAGLSAMALSIVGLLPLSLYSNIETNRAMKRLEENGRGMQK